MFTTFSSQPILNSIEKMVFQHNHSITSSQPQTPPPPPPPPPPPSPAMRMATSSPAGAFPSKLHQNLTFRWPLLNNGSSHLSNNPNRFRYGRLPLPEAGGLNPVLRIGPSPLNPARSSYNINTNRPVAGPVDGPVVGPVEGSERKVDEKGKSKLFIRLPMKKRALGPGYVPSFTEPDPEPESEPEAEAEDEAESEPEAEREGEGEGDDADVGVKTWNLRPRRPAVAKAKEVPNGGGGGGSGQRRRNGSGSGSGAGRRNRGANNKGKEKVNNNKKKKEEKGKGKVLSLTLTKEEIEEDFLKMTDSKPPKKPKRRSKALQKHLDATFPGLWLNGRTPDMYRIPDPPLKG